MLSGGRRRQSLDAWHRRGARSSDPTAYPTGRQTVGTWRAAVALQKAKPLHIAEVAVAKIREDAPFDKVCYIGCGVTTGVGAVLNTAKVEPGAKCVVFGLGGIGLNVIQGLRLAGADMIIGVDVNNGKKEWGERFGMTHFVNPKEVGSELVAHLVNMTKRGADQIGGADYTFDCTGNIAVMRQALEACHRGWGQSVIIGVAPSGAEIATRPFQLVTGRVWTV